MNYNEDFESLPEDEMFTSEAELKREIKRLERQIKKEQKYHDLELDSFRGQIRDLLAKNMELTETLNIFAKGLENLKKEYILTETHYYSRRGVMDLTRRIEELVKHDKRIVAIVPMHQDAHGYTTEALIITEHTTKVKPITKLFKE